MMAVDLLRFIVPFGVPFRWPPPCHRACRASASARHVAQHPAPLSHVQASCLERARPGAVAAFAGALAATSAAPSGRRCPERQRSAKAEGKIKGRGTPACAKPTCTWGWRGTRRGRLCAVGERNAASILAKLRASCAGLRWPWLESLHEPS